MLGQNMRREEARMHTYARTRTHTHTKMTAKNWSRHRSSGKFKFLRFARVSLS